MAIKQMLVDLCSFPFKHLYRYHGWLTISHTEGPGTAGVGRRKVQSGIYHQPRDFPLTTSTSGRCCHVYFKQCFEFPHFLVMQNDVMKVRDLII